MPAEPAPSEGPAVVTAGDASGPKVIVLDPAGAGNHGELPATWRPLAERRGVFWCRVAVGGALTAADDLLGDRSPGDPAIAVVAGGPFAAEALQLVERHPGSVEHLLLVGPGPDALDDAVAEVRETGTDVRVVTPDSAGAGTQVPLGHPDVVAAVRSALGDV